MVEIILAVLGGSALAALISQIGEYFRERKNHQEKDQDEESEDIKIIKEALCYLLYDRIRYLGEKYLENGTVDFDDRRILNNMHQVYHNKLGGNGDLDNLIKNVNKLPLQL